jgi:glutathione S-transferase
MHRLYHYPLSPFSRKVRLVLAEKKIEVELVEERYWEERADFLRLNPAGQVPVLRTEALILPESNAICEYLEERHPNPPLLPKTPEARAEARRLTYWFDDKFYREVTRNLIGERVEKKVMGRGYPDSKNVKAGSQKIKFHLDYMAWLLDLVAPRLPVAAGRPAARISAARALRRPGLLNGRGERSPCCAAA